MFFKLSLDYSLTLVVSAQFDIYKLTNTFSTWQHVKLYHFAFSSRGQIHTVEHIRRVSDDNFGKIMLRTSKKLWEHIDFGLSICLSMRPFIKNCACKGLEISYMDSSSKSSWNTFFFLVRVISLSGVMPLWKNQNEIWCMPYLMNHAC